MKSALLVISFLLSVNLPATEIVPPGILLVDLQSWANESPEDLSYWPLNEKLLEHSGLEADELIAILGNINPQTIDHTKNLELIQRCKDIRGVSYTFIFERIQNMSQDELSAPESYRLIYLHESK